MISDCLKLFIGDMLVMHADELHFVTPCRTIIPLPPSVETTIDIYNYLCEIGYFKDNLTFVLFLGDGYGDFLPRLLVVFKYIEFFNWPKEKVTIKIVLESSMLVPNTKHLMNAESTLERVKIALKLFKLESCNICYDVNDTLYQIFLVMRLYRVEDSVFLNQDQLRKWTLIIFEHLNLKISRYSSQIKINLSSFKTQINNLLKYNIVNEMCVSYKIPIFDSNYSQQKTIIIHPYENFNVYERLLVFKRLPFNYTTTLRSIFSDYQIIQISYETPMEQVLVAMQKGNFFISHLSGFTYLAQYYRVSSIQLVPSEKDITESPECYSYLSRYVYDHWITECYKNPNILEQLKEVIYKPRFFSYKSAADCKKQIIKIVKQPERLVIDKRNL